MRNFKLFIIQEVNSERCTARTLTWFVNRMNFPHEKEQPEAVWKALHKRKFKPFSKKLKVLENTLATFSNVSWLLL